MKEYSFLKEFNEIETKPEENSTKRYKRVNPLWGAGIGLGAAMFAPSVVASPATQYFGKRTFDVSDLDYLNGVKVNGQDLQKYLNDKNLEITNYPKSGPYYNPANNTINMGLNEEGGKNVGKSVFAHELGHSVSMGKSDLKKISYFASKTTTSVAVLAQLVNCFNNNDESRKKIGKAISIAGGVSALPMIAEEINASIQGSNMLGLEGADYAKSFIGIASYITLALSPTILYGVSEGTRKLLGMIRRLKKENPEANQNINNLKKQNVKVRVK